MKSNGTVSVQADKSKRSRDFGLENSYMAINGGAWLVLCLEIRTNSRIPEGEFGPRVRSFLKLDGDETTYKYTIQAPGRAR